MKILGLDSSGKTASVAILDEFTLIGEYTISNDKTHSQKLVPMINELVENLNINLEDIDMFACSTGPGSFTGLRIGISTIKAMAFALKKPTISIPTLLGLAYNISNFNGLICPMIDARNENVYSAIFKIENEKYTLINDYSAENINYIIDILSNLSGDIIFIGDGATSYYTTLKNSFDARANFAPTHLNSQKASSIAKACLDKVSLDGFDITDTLSPIYLRKSQAERMLDLNAKI